MVLRTVSSKRNSFLVKLLLLHASCQRGHKLNGIWAEKLYIVRRTITMMESCVHSRAQLRRLAEPLQSKLKGDYNDGQLRAIAAAIGREETTINDHQHLGPGVPRNSRKTKTIVAIHSALLALRSSKQNFPRTGIENQPPPSQRQLGFGWQHGNQVFQNRGTVPNLHLIAQAAQFNLHVHFQKFYHKHCKRQ